MDKPYPTLDSSHARDAAELTRSPSRTTTALGDALRTLIAEPAIAEAFAAVTGAAVTGVAVDWPRLTAREALARWLRPADVLVELTRTPAREPLELGLVLHTESATRLVERMLGGSASSAMPSAIGALSDAECGVLAYAVARLCAAHPSGFVVRDVRAAPPPSALPEPVVLWPLSLQSAFAPLEGLLLLSSTLAASAPAIHTIELVLRDVLAGDAPLAPGEVLTSDSWSLTDTTDGLTGAVRIATPGIATELAARLSCGAARVSGPAPTAPPDALTLVLADRALSLAAVASLASGEPCAFADLGMQPALLRRADTVLAEGELVIHRGALGLRITAT